MNGHEHHHHNGRHEHGGFSSRGMFDDRKVLNDIGLLTGQTFLDAGCADGHFSFEASKIVGENGKVISVDKHVPSLDQLRASDYFKNSNNILVIEHDLLEPLPVPPSSLDHFFLSNVVHGFAYNNEIDLLVENIRTTLKNGGILSMIEWDRNNVINGPPEDHRISYDDVKRILEPHDFIPIGISKVTDEHVLMLFKTP